MNNIGFIVFIGIIILSFIICLIVFINGKISFGEFLGALLTILAMFLGHQFIQKITTPDIEIETGKGESAIISGNNIPSKEEGITPEEPTTPEETTTSEKSTESEKPTAPETQKPSEPIQTGSSEMVSGWVQYGESWKWRMQNGDYIRDGFLKDGDTFYFFVNEIMVTGWQLIDRNWYYFDQSGAMQKNTWVGDYYLKDDGSMLYDCRAVVNGKTYKFDSSGAAVEEDDNGDASYPGSDWEGNDVPSTLSFSDDCNISIYEGEFCLEGYVASNYWINSIRYTYYTPYLYFDVPYNGDVDINTLEDRYLMDLSLLDEKINSLDVEGKYNWEGEYELTIFVEDSYGNESSIVLNWHY